MDHIFECPICLNTFNNTVSLPCGEYHDPGTQPFKLWLFSLALYEPEIQLILFFFTPQGHLYCQECLTQHINAPDEDLTCFCPDCRTPFHIGTFPLL